MCYFQILLFGVGIVTVYILYTSLIYRVLIYRALLDSLVNRAELNRALIHEIVEQGDEEDLKVYLFYVQFFPNFLVHKFLRAKDRDGETALHYVATDGKLGMVILLVNADSSLVRVKDNDGKTAKDWAHYRNETQVVEYLKRYDILVNI